MNRKLFIKYSALISGAAILKPQEIFAEPRFNHKKNILCIWGDGVHISDLKNYYDKHDAQNIVAKSNFNLRYEGELTSHQDAMKHITANNSTIINIDVLNEKFDASSYLDNNSDKTIIIRFTGCDAGHYNNKLYHTAIEKYKLNTQNIEQYLYSNNLYKDGQILLIATEMGRDIDGGEMETNSGISYSHHHTEEARKIGVLAILDSNYSDKLNWLNKINAVKELTN